MYARISPGWIPLHFPRRYGAEAIHLPSSCHPFSAPENRHVTSARSYIPLYYSCGNKVIFLVTFPGIPITSDVRFLSCKFQDALLFAARDATRKFSYSSLADFYNLRLQMFAFARPRRLYLHILHPLSQKILIFQALFSGVFSRFVKFGDDGGACYVVRDQSRGNRKIIGFSAPSY